MYFINFGKFFNYFIEYVFCPFLFSLLLRLPLCICWYSEALSIFLLFFLLFFSLNNFSWSLSKFTDSFVCHLNLLLNPSVKYSYSHCIFPLQNLYLGVYNFCFCVEKSLFTDLCHTLFHCKSTTSFNFLKHTYNCCFKVLTTKSNNWDTQRVSIS